MERQQEKSLFEPTLDRHRIRDDSLPRPWRLSSQFYVAFFGGPLAAAAVGVLNGRRLGLDAARLVGIAVAGAAAFVGSAVAIASMDDDGSPRLALIIGGVAVYVLSRWLQKPADLRWRAGRSDGDAYGSLWGPGLAIVLVGGLAAAAVLLLAGVVS